MLVKLGEYRYTMKFPDQSFFDKLQSSIEDIVDDEQLSIGRVDHPFTVPKGYFDQLKSNILTSVDSNQKKGRVIPFPKFKVWYAAAALLLFSSVGLWIYNDSPSEIISLQSLSQDEIIAYLENEPIDYSEISNSAEFTAEEMTSLTADNLPLGEDFEFFIDSPELLIEEIEQLDEK
ncbi:MAG: hypothetical protein ACI9V1_001565 [Spirosomataceae bacterium]|jgi:hypothetical protein